DALTEFGAVLKKEPNRYRALLGASKSARMAGEAEKVQAFAAQIREQAKDADARPAEPKKQGKTAAAKSAPSGKQAAAKAAPAKSVRQASSVAKARRMARGPAVAGIRFAGASPRLRIAENSWVRQRAGFWDRNDRAR